MRGRGSGNGFRFVRQAKKVEVWWLEFSLELRRVTHFCLIALCCVWWAGGGFRNGPGAA